jgi:hypothetical protein
MRPVVPPSQKGDKMKKLLYIVLLVHVALAILKCF